MLASNQNIWLLQFMLKVAVDGGYSCGIDSVVDESNDAVCLLIAMLVK